MFSDSDLLMLEGSPNSFTEHEKAKMSINTQEKLLMLYNSNRLIEQVDIYIPSIRLRIGRFSIGAVSEDQIVKIAQITENNLQYQLKYYDGALHTLMPYRISELHKSPKYIFDIKLSNTEINKLLIQLNENSLSGSAIYNTEDLFYFQGNEEVKEQLYKLSLSTGKIANTYDINQKTFFCNQVQSDQLNITLLHCIPYSDAFEKLKMFTNFFIYLVIINVIIIFAFLFYINSYIKKPLESLMTAFRQFRKGNIQAKVLYNRKDEFQMLASSFNFMISEWEKMLENEYNQKILIQRSELKQLQSQIDPHFLYNSFFILSRRVKKGDIEGAVGFSEQLGEYFKFITKNTSDEVALKVEVKHTKNYAGIQMTRFGNRIKVEFEEIPAEIEELMVPRLILQPVIENAFEHGLKNKEEDGLLRVRIQNVDTKVVIEIEDNGEDLSDEKLDRLNVELNHNDIIPLEITAIFNINKRLKIYYGENYGITLHRSELGGLKVRLLLKQK